VNTAAITHRQNPASFVQISVEYNIGRVHRAGSIGSWVEREEKEGRKRGRKGEESNTEHIDKCNLLYREVLYGKASASQRPRGKRRRGQMWW